MHQIFVFNHNDSSLPHKSVKSVKKQRQALVVGCKIVYSLAKDFNEDVYVFMENKELDFYGMRRSGVHIYNGNVPWSVFVTGCVLSQDKIGPLGYDKSHEIDLGEDN